MPGLISAARVRTAGRQSSALPALGLSASAVGALPASNSIWARVFSSALPAACTSPTKANCCAAGVHWTSFPKRRLTWRSAQRCCASTPATIGYRFLPVLPGFQQRYPQVQLELDFNDRIVDVVSEGLDAVIRSGELADSSLTARRLGAFASSSVRRRATCRRTALPAMWATLAGMPHCASVTPPPESCIRGRCRASKAMPGRAFHGDDLQQHGSRAGRCDRLHGPGLDARLPRR